MKDLIKKILNTAYWGLLYLWQLPQNVVGLVLLMWYESNPLTLMRDYKDVHVFYASEMRGGISLGRYIILPYRYSYVETEDVRQTHDHEWGHTRQSLYLGWLYLIVIGLPSLTWAWLHTSFRYFAAKDYYSFYTEKWADRLGGVKR